jgi:hypothetical protein
MPGSESEFGDTDPAEKTSVPTDAQRRIVRLLIYRCVLFEGHRGGARGTKPREAPKGVRGQNMFPCNHFVTAS